MIRFKRFLLFFLNYKTKLRSSAGIALVEKALVIAVVATTAVASVDAFLLHRTKGFNCDATDAATRILQVYYNQSDPADYSKWSTVRTRTSEALAQLGYYPNTLPSASDSGKKIVYSFEREDESGNSMPAVNRVPFTYLTPFPGQSKARLYTKDCDSNGTCSFRSLAEVEHPAANNPTASTLPIVVVAEKYKSITGFFDQEIVSCTNFDNLFVPTTIPDPNPTPTPNSTPDPNPTPEDTPDSEPTPNPTFPFELPTASPTPEATETPGGACKIENGDADGGSDISEKTACENQNEGGNCHSFNDKSCACGCCPEEQKKCEENEGDVQPYNPSSADGSESCGCACGGDVGSGGAGEQSRKAMREECEQKAGDWIFTSKPAPECGECTCDPDAKQKCEADGGVWSEATCTCSECSPDSVEEDQCIADGCAWLELNCECRCGPTGAIWDPVLNLFVDKLTGRPLADINLNPVVDVVGPVGTLWDPERKIFVDPRSGLPLYDSFGEPLPGTPAFNAPQGTTWDPTRELYVDSETGVPRFDAERNPVAPGAIVTDQTRSDQAIIDPESPDIMLMP